LKLWENDLLCGAVERLKRMDNVLIVCDSKVDSKTCLDRLRTVLHKQGTHNKCNMKNRSVTFNGMIVRFVSITEYRRMKTDGYFKNILFQEEFERRLVELENYTLRKCFGREYINKITNFENYYIG